MTFAAGAVQQTFNVTPLSTLLSRAVTITASYGGRSKAASLTITLCSCDEFLGRMPERRGRQLLQIAVPALFR
jgi:hypothetical protein